MGIQVTQRYRGSNLVKVSGQWVARESWIVTGTTDKAAAIEAACAFDTPHGDNPNMRAGYRNAENVGGPLSWIVLAEFTFGDHGLCAGSPLDEAPQLIWDFGTTTVPTDTDVSGNPILNSAGQPFDPPITETVPIVGLTVRRAEPFFSVQKALAYMDHVNSDSFTVTGAGGVDPGQAYCQYIRPAQPYTLNAPFVWVEYRFEFMPDTDPFQAHPIDVGRMGWYSKSGTATLGNICDGNGNPVNFDVRLDGTGKPMDSHLKVMDSSGSPQTPIANPSLPTGLAVDGNYSTTTQKTLIWKNKNAVAFKGLI